MKNFRRWTIILVCLVILAGTLGALKQYADAKQNPSDGCGICIVWDTETEQQEVYAYMDEESDLKIPGCACSCE